MTQWGSFLVVTLIILVVVLVLARQSQALIEEYETDDQSEEGQSVDGHSTDDQSGVRLQLERPQTNGSTPDTPSVEPTTDTELGETHIADDEFIPPAKRQPEPEQELVLTPLMMQANVAVTQGIVAVLVIAAAWYFEIPAAAFGIVAEPLSTGWPAIVGGLAFGLVLWVGNEGATRVADVIGASYDERVRELLAPESKSGWLLLFGVVLPLIAISEELLFRAALIGVPAAGFDISPWLLAVGSSAAFALGHGAQGRVGIVVTGLLGFVLAAGYIVTGSLLLVVIAHYVINALEFFTHEYR